MALDVLRTTLRSKNSELSLKLFEAKRSLYEAIRIGRHDEAVGWINTLRTIKSALPPDEQLSNAIDGLAEVVVGMARP
jgi:hypothetical protein